MISRFSLVLPMLLLSLNARADSPGTMGQFLDYLLLTYNSACSEGGAWYEQLKTPDAIAIDARHTVCECIPNRAANLKSSLSTTELELPFSDSMRQRYMTQVVDPCSAAQARAMYGQDCADRFSKYKGNSANYCACMSNYMHSLSDREATQLGIESASYLPAMQLAKKQGLPLPEPPPVYKRFASAESSCSER